MLLSKVLEKLTRILGLVFMSVLPRVGEKSKDGYETTVKGWNIWSWKSITYSFNKKNGLLCEIPQDLLQTRTNRVIGLFKQIQPLGKKKKNSKMGALKWLNKKEVDSLACDSKTGLSFWSTCCSVAFVFRSAVSATVLLAYIQKNEACVSHFLTLLINLLFSTLMWIPRGSEILVFCGSCWQVPGITVEFIALANLLVFLSGFWTVTQVLWKETAK